MLSTRLKLISFAFCLSLLPVKADYVYAIDSRSILALFDTERPAVTLSLSVVRGLQPGETVLGLDFRPATKSLYALGSTSRIYIIDPVSGLATPLGDAPFTPALDGTKFGFSFNPTVDRIRLTSNNGQNLRLHPDTGAVAATDGRLNYADGMTPGVVASAYTNSMAGATSTTLYNFDLARRAVVIQSPPNDGTLAVNIHLPESTDFSDLTSLDISPDTHKGFLATREKGAIRSQLYEIDFTAKTVTLNGTIGVLDQVSALAIVPGGIKPLYDRLGGIEAISAVIDDFLGNVVADDRINKFFSETVMSPERVRGLRQGLIDLVCVGAGGPCEYKGRDMRSAHVGMKITDVEFDALVEDLVKSLDKFKVPAPEKAALLGVLAPMRGDIVEAKQMKMITGR